MKKIIFILLLFILTLNTQAQLKHQPGMRGYIVGENIGNRPNKIETTIFNRKGVLTILTLNNGTIIEVVFAQYGRVQIKDITDFAASVQYVFNINLDLDDPIEYKNTKIDKFYYSTMYGDIGFLIAVKRYLDDNNNNSCSMRFVIIDNMLRKKYIDEKSREI